MERIWLKQYPAGVPADIDVTQYSSLVELLEESFAKFADRKAFICMDKSISYRDLDEMSAAFGAYLQSKGLQKGARVALMMPNVLQYPISTAAGRSLKRNKPQLTREDVAFLQYTGGTTGVSKGATLLHKNILANVLQNDAWLQPALKKPPIVDQMVIVCALPLYHIFALTACYLLGVRAGGTNLLIPNPRDMAGFVKELTKYQVSFFPAVNTLYNGLLNTPGFDKLDFSKLKVSNGGGMATPKPGAEKWLQVTGWSLSEGYGLSETPPTLTGKPPPLEKVSRTNGPP